MKNWRCKLVTVPNVLEPTRDREDVLVPIGTGVVISDLMPVHWQDDPNTVVLFNGERVEPDRWAARYVSDGDEVLLTKKPPKDIGTLVAVTLLGIEAATAGAIVVAGLVNIAIGVGISYIAGKVAPKPEIPAQEESRVYGGGQIRTVQGSGWTRPKVYGKMKVGGTIIHAGSRHHVGAGFHPTKSPGWFRQLGDFRTVVINAWAQGPIGSICGITSDTDNLYLPNAPNNPAGAPLFTSTDLRVNGNPIINSVGRGTVSHRMGKNDQDAFPYLVGGLREGA